VRRGNFRLRVNHLHATGRIVLLGRNGSGKSTLLKCVAGFIKPIKGVIRLDGEEITYLPPDKRGVGYLPQDTFRLPLTPSKALSYFSKIFRIDAASLETELSLTNLLEKESLSTGESQIINLSIILLKKPKLLLLDEPTSSLDYVNRRLFWGFIQKLKKPMLYVTHDPLEAAVVGEEYYLLEDGGTYGPFENRLKDEIDDVISLLDPYMERMRS